MDQKDIHNLKHRFPEEAKLLPLEYLDEEDKILAEKCINQEEFTDEELKKLKLLLVNYRPYFKEYNIETVEKNIEENLKIVKTSDQLLNLLNNPNRFRIDMKYTIDGQKYLFKLKINPLEDKDYISLIDNQTRVFKDLTHSEKKIFAKSQLNQQLTPEEEKMQKHIQDKINELYLDSSKNAEQITEIIAKSVDFVDDPEKTYEEKLAFWMQIDLQHRVNLFYKIKEILNIGNELEDDLFPSIR